MTLLSELAEIGATSTTPRTLKPDYPSGWQPGTRFDGTTGEVCGKAPAAGVSFDGLLREWGYDPALVQIVEPIERRSWDAAIGGGLVQRMHYVKARIQSRITTDTSADMDSLIRAIAKHRRTKRLPVSGSYALGAALSDFQLGKPDGDGTQGIVDRVLAAGDSVLGRAKDLRKIGYGLGTLLAPGLGDIVEGCDGFYSNQTYGVQLSLTEQMRVGRRLLTKLFTQWSPHFEQIVIPVVPGNHGEIRKNGKSFTEVGDNLDTAVFEQVAAVLASNPAYDNVSFVFPKKDELTVTLGVAGTVMCFCHGHNFGSQGAMKWWAGQAHGQQAPGDATVLVCGHRHNLQVLTDGPKTVLQAPAMESLSAYYRNAHGSPGAPGMMTFTVGAEGWDNLKVL